MNKEELDIYNILVGLGYGNAELIIMDKPDEDESEKRIYCRINFRFKFHKKTDISNGNIQFYANDKTDLLQQVDKYFKEDVDFEILNFI